MTREEAIGKAITIVSYFEAHFAKTKEAREDAANIIEALEQEPIDCANAEHDADGCLGYSTDRGGYSYCQTCLECPKASINNWDKEQEACDDMGEVSDGYHTFNQLYHQRAILFATIVNQNKDIAWKSYKHSDGKHCFDSNGEWFIVGIDTPEGSYTYHYSKEYWDYFKCKELDCGKEWDGHTEKDVTRLLSLEHEICTDVISRRAVLDAIQKLNIPEDMCVFEIMSHIEVAIATLQPVTSQPKTGKWITVDKGLKVTSYKCSECGRTVRDDTGYDVIKDYPYCHCGAKMQEVIKE